MKQKKKREKEGFLAEVRDSIIGELLWNMLIFVPRMIIRFLKYLF